MSPPADSEEPGVRECYRAVSGRPLESRLPPAVEPATRRSRVDRPGSNARSVPPCVEQHVPDRIPHLARRLQNPHVVPVRQDLATPRERPLCCTYHPHSDGLHSPPESVAILCLDNEMSVVPQEGVVHQPKLPALTTPRERALEGPNETRRAERRDAFANPGRHVARVARSKGRPTAVADQGVRTRLSSSAISTHAKR